MITCLKFVKLSVGTLQTFQICRLSMVLQGLKFLHLYPLISNVIFWGKNAVFLGKQKGRKVQKFDCIDAIVILFCEMPVCTYSEIYIYQ